jgi:hypothetical protein
MPIATRRRLAPIVLEQVLFKTSERDGAQKPRRHDAVRVDVLAGQDETRPGDARDS